MASVAFLAQATPARLWHARPELVVAISTYLTGSTVFGVLAFRNFPAPLVISLQLTLALVPTLLIMWGAPEKTDDQRLAPFGIIRAVLGGLALVMLQATALVAGFDYHSNFAYEKLEVGAGYHVDSAFHVAIIQNILANGRPSTGQHLQPFLAYHWLSHYFDAAIVRIFGLDAWDSYVLVYYAKATSIVLAFMYFVERATRSRSPAVFWTALAVTIPAFAAGWYPTLSHAQWVPVLLLLLAGPWLADVINCPDVGIRRLIKLSALVVALTLGKGSIGMAVVVLFGASVVLKRLFSLRVAFTLSIWGIGLLWWAGLAGVASGRSRGDLQPVGLVETLAFALSRLEYSTGLIFSLLGMSLLLFFVKQMSCRALPLGMELSLATGVIGIVSIFASANSSDAYYYFLGLCYAALVVVLPTVLSRSEQASGPSAGLVLVGLALAVSPWTAGAQLSPYQSFSSMAASVMSLNGVTYHWHNATKGPEEWVSLWRLVSGRVDQTRIDDPNRHQLETLSEELNRTLAGIGSSRSSAFLFVPSEVFAGIAVTTPGNVEWSTGMLISATTGMVLLHGIPPEAPSSTYGFASYTDAGEEARWKSAKDVTWSDLCSFGKPVLVVRQMTPVIIEASCLPE